MNRNAVILTLLAVVGAAYAGDFELKSAAPLSLSYKGVPLIASDGGIPEPASKPSVTRITVPGWEEVLQLWGTTDCARSRREIGLSADRFEFTLQRLVQADVHGFVRYDFIVPHEFLDGYRAEIVGTGLRTPKEYIQKRQLIGPLGPGGIANVKPILYLRVHHPAGTIDFDFNPRGWWKGQKTCTPRAADWVMRRRAEGYVFSTAFSRTIYGTLQEFKFVIRRADKRPVLEVHPWAANRWTTPYRNVLRLNMGTTPVEGYTAVPSDCARWTGGVRPEPDERFRTSAGTRHEAVAPANPKGEAVLEIDTGRAGYYLLNMLVGASHRSVGPCEVSVGEKHKATCPAVPKGSCESWALVAFARDGRLALRFRGDFRLAALGVTPMMYENEDYLFGRSWWISPDWNPEGNVLDMLSSRRRTE